MTLVYSINWRFLLNKHNNQGANKDCCSPVWAILRQITWERHQCPHSQLFYSRHRNNVFVYLKRENPNDECKLNLDVFHNNLCYTDLMRAHLQARLGWKASPVASCTHHMQFLVWAFINWSADQQSGPLMGSHQHLICVCIHSKQVVWSVTLN